jgi:pterin-4a-carbinolamine dehydratase
VKRQCIVARLVSTDLGEANELAVHDGGHLEGCRLAPLPEQEDPTGTSETRHFRFSCYSEACATSSDQSLSDLREKHFSQVLNSYGPFTVIYRTHDTVS